MYPVSIDFPGICGSKLQQRFVFPMFSSDCEVRHALGKLKFKEKKKPFPSFYATLVVTQLLLPFTYELNFFSYISISLHEHKG